jgi:hypothetical protein
VDAGERLCLPEVDERALAGLKFSEALPERLATATLAARLADLDSAVRVLAEPTGFTTLRAGAEARRIALPEHDPSSEPSTLEAVSHGIDLGRGGSQCRDRRR